MRQTHVMMRPVMLSRKMQRAMQLGLTTLLIPLLIGCAAVPAGQANDPWEGYNRQMFKFNDTVDSWFLKPLATGYVKAVPALVRTGVNNFFFNLTSVVTAFNKGLQLKPQETTETLLRFSVNTVMGFGGVLDVASEIGIPKHKADLGQTLGRWGVPMGPYVVLPLLGPTTVRDGLADVASTRLDPRIEIDDAKVNNNLRLLEIVNTRAKLLQATNVLEDASLDRYTFLRDFWLQAREAEVNPLPLETENFDDEEPPSKTPESGPKPVSLEQVKPIVSPSLEEVQIPSQKHPAEPNSTPNVPSVVAPVTSPSGWLQSEVDEGAEWGDDLAR